MTLSDSVCVCTGVCLFVCLFECLGDANDVGIWLFYGWSYMGWEVGGRGVECGREEGGCHVSMWKIFSNQCKKGWVGVANGPKDWVFILVKKKVKIKKVEIKKYRNKISRYGGVGIKMSLKISIICPKFTFCRTFFIDKLFTK